MKKTVVRVWCLCLVIIMALSVIASCKKNENGADESETQSEKATDVIETEENTDEDESESAEDTESDTQTEAATESNSEESDTEEIEEDERTSNLPERIDLGGKNFVIAQALNDKKQWVAPVEGKDSDAINVALVKRNELLQTYYKITIDVADYANPGNDFSKTFLQEFEIAALGGKPIGDIAYAVSGQVMKTLIINGYIEDVNTLDPLNLDASYYDQRLRQEYNIEGRLFCLEGDFGVHDELRTHVVGVNKAKYDSFGYNETYGSLYDIVEDGEWTLDLMLEMAKNTSDYASLGTNMTKDNNWGIISESPFPYVVYLGTGNKVINVGDSGALTISYNDDGAFQLMEEMLQDITNRVVVENNETLIADASKGVLNESNYFGEAQGMFAQGKALFRTSTLVDFTKYYDMEDEFGILPVPKYDAEQDFYYSWCSSQAHTPLFVPRNSDSTELEKTANVIEGMAYFSKYMTGKTQSLHDAFYQNMADAKLCLTVNDRNMLALIFEQRTFDLDHVLNISNTCNVVANVAKGTSTSLPSSLATIQVKMTDPDEKINPLKIFLNEMNSKY